MSGYINPIAFEFGPFQIHWYAIAIVTGIVLAVWMAVSEAKRVGIDPDNIYDFVLWGVPLSFIGSRLYYVIFEWKYYAAHPDQIIAIWNGGIAIYGGLIAGGIFLYYFCRKRHLSIWKYLDIAAPAVILAQGIGRWGNFFNHEAFGPITSASFLQSLHIPQWIIDNMKIDGYYRQPTFLYESVWDILGCLMMVTYRHFKKELREGEIACLYLIWYSVGRFFIEGMRTDSLYIGPFRVSQLLSVVLFVLGISLLIFKYHNPKTIKYIRERS